MRYEKETNLMKTGQQQRKTMKKENPEEIVMKTEKQKNT